MKNGISKLRLRRIADLRRRRAAKTTEKVSFANGTFLAVVYSVVAVLVSLGCEVLTSRFAGHPAGGDLRWTLCTDTIVLAISVAVARLLLGLLSPKILARNSRLLLLCVTAILGNALHSAIVIAFAQPRILNHLPEYCKNIEFFIPFLVPYMFVPMLSTLLCGAGAGISLGAAMAVQNLVFVPGAESLPVTLTGMLLAFAVPFCVQNVHKRGTLLEVSGLVLALQIPIVAAAVCLGKILHKTGFADVNPAICIVYTLTSVALSLIAVLLALPVLERIFGACSNIRIGEFADLSNPILERLSLEAPGTYHHSICVAQLAAAAAEQIGANAILARVGSYYHDIGKLSRPGSFTENLAPGQTNPHDSMQPSVSALVLASHVKDGVALAIDGNLPAAVRDVIEEHHGSTLMSFFYNKAVEQAAAKARETGVEAERVSKAQFRYAGRRPRTAESAIVLLADSVEASSRSLNAPTPQIIENHVNRIVSEKAADGQLNDSPLTYRDVEEIKRCFIATLGRIMHTRVAYPSAREGGAVEEKGVDNDDGNDSASPQTRP